MSAINGTAEAIGIPRLKMTMNVVPGSHQKLYWVDLDTGDVIGELLFSVRDPAKYAAPIANSFALWVNEQVRTVMPIPASALRSTKT